MHVELIEGAGNLVIIVFDGDFMLFLLHSCLFFNFIYYFFEYIFFSRLYILHVSQVWHLDWYHYLIVNTNFLTQIHHYRAGNKNYTEEFFVKWYFVRLKMLNIYIYPKSNLEQNVAMWYFWWKNRIKLCIYDKIYFKWQFVSIAKMLCL